MNKWVWFENYSAGHIPTLTHRVTTQVYEPHDDHDHLYYSPHQIRCQTKWSGPGGDPIRADNPMYRMFGNLGTPSHSKNKRPKVMVWWKVVISSLYIETPRNIKIALGIVVKCQVLKLMFSYWVSENPVRTKDQRRVAAGSSSAREDPQWRHSIPSEFLKYLKNS